MVNLKRQKHQNKILILLPTLWTIICCTDPLVERPFPPASSDIDSTTNALSKMDWWNDARYGMFIHYGIYSALAGEYIGKNTDGVFVHFQSLGNQNNHEVDSIKIGPGAGAEWILYEASIPRDSYRKYASKFTAEKFDPKAIVSLAQKAGMKYIILTAKHHEGFCLWNSDVTQWNISQSPAGSHWNNDLIAPLAKAARDAGLKFGIYFSHTRDWMHPGGIGAIPELGMKEYSYAENQEYMETYTYPMISELLNRYHPDIFWWNSVNPYEEFAIRCNSLITNSSSTIIQSDRLSTLPSYKGDFATPEQSMDEETEYDNMELCMTMNNSWGYNQFDTTWKRPEYVLWCLLRAEKLGGNLLLNIGPRADGTIPEKCQEILETVGDWIHTNAEGVYETRKSPFRFNLPYGPTTWRKISNIQHLYYHIFYWDGSGELWLPGIMNAPDEVELSFPANPQMAFQVEAVDGIGLHLTGLPRAKISDLCTMLNIKFKSEPNLKEGSREIDHTIHLDALGAQISEVVIDDFDTKPCINWYSGKRLNYQIRIINGGVYKINTLLAGFYPGEITFDFGKGITLTGNNQATPGGFSCFEWQYMGNVYLTPGEYNLSITNKQTDSWLKIREFKMELQ